MNNSDPVDNTNQSHQPIASLNHFRDNKCLSFLLVLRDLRSREERNIETMIGQILRKINLHSRSPCRFDTNLYLLQKDGTQDYAVYLQCPHSKAQGFNR